MLVLLRLRPSFALMHILSWSTRPGLGHVGLPATRTLAGTGACWRDWDGPARQGTRRGSRTQSAARPTLCLLPTCVLRPARRSGDKMVRCGRKLARLRWGALRCHETPLTHSIIYTSSHTLHPPPPLSLLSSYPLYTHSISMTPPPTLHVSHRPRVPPSTCPPSTCPPPSCHPPPYIHPLPA